MYMYMRRGQAASPSPASPARKPGARVPVIRVNDNSTINSIIISNTLVI